MSEHTAPETAVSDALPEELPEEILDAALLAGRGVYRAHYQLSHDPSVVRMVDSAVEACLQAAAPLMFKQVLEDAAEDFGAGEWLDAFIEQDVNNDITAVQAACKWLLQRAAAQIPVSTTHTTATTSED